MFKIGYWGAQSFVDLFSIAKNKGEQWGYNFVLIAFTRFLLETNKTVIDNLVIKSDKIKYFIEKGYNADLGGNYWAGFEIASVGNKQNNIYQSEVINTALEKIRTGEYKAPQYIGFSLRDKSFINIKGTMDNQIKGFNYIGTQSFADTYIKAYSKLHDYYGKLNILDFDLEAGDIGDTSKRPSGFSSKIKMFINNFTDKYKKLYPNNLLTAAPGFGNLYYNDIKNLDYIIYQDYSNISSNTHPPINFKSIIGYSSYKTHDTVENINSCVVSNGWKGASNWDIEWDVFGTKGNNNMWDKMYQCCLITSDKNTCDMYGPYNSYEYANNVLKSELPNSSIRLSESNIILPRICYSAPSIKNISIKSNNLYIEY
jgi:hypothetical protein